MVCSLLEAAPVLEALEICLKSEESVNGLERYWWLSNVIEVLALYQHWTSIWLWERYPRWMALVTNVSC